MLPVLGAYFCRYQLINITEEEECPKNDRFHERNVSDMWVRSRVRFNMNRTRYLLNNCARSCDCLIFYAFATFVKSKLRCMLKLLVGVWVGVYRSVLPDDEQTMILVTECNL